MATSSSDNSSSSDPIGPHDDEEQQTGDRVEGGGTEGTPPLNFDDDEIYSGRGKEQRTGGTANAPGGDSGRLGPPGEQLSDSNGPSDPDRRTPSV
jgi:hypothetical protein